MAKKHAETIRGVRPFWFGVLVFLGAGVGAFSFLVLGLLVSHGPLHDAFISAHGLFFGSQKNPLTPADQEALLGMIHNGQILPAQDFISDLSGFYQTVIQILVTVLTVLGILAYMYIKAVSTERAEQAAESKAESVVGNYLDSHVFWELAKRHAEESVEDAKKGILSYQEDIEGWWNTFVNDSNERLNAIEERLAVLDTDEDEGSANELENQPAIAGDANGDGGRS